VVAALRRSGAIRLLWLIDSLAAGGAEALTLELARAHDRACWRLDVAFLKSIAGNPFEPELRAADVPLHDLGARHLRDLRAFRRLLRLLAAEQFELVHAHLAYASIWTGWAAPRSGVPAVATLHVLPGRRSLLSREGLRERLLVAALNRGHARVIAVSEAVRTAWQARGVRAERLVVAPNGVDVERFAPLASSERTARRVELGWPDGAPVLLAAATLRPGKGIEDLLAAFALLAERLPGARLAIAGEGSERAELAARAVALGISARCEWLGFRRDLDRVLPAADLFVLPSHFDALPTVLLEAMAAGCPVVATATGGVPEIVAGGTGWLVPPRDVAALAAGIEKALAEPVATARAARAARERVEREFSLAAWCTRLDRIYAETLAMRRQRGGRGGSA
jgi:glycosyltransferase involved in cell wall biosynthesis